MWRLLVEILNLHINYGVGAGGFSSPSMVALKVSKDCAPITGFPLTAKVGVEDTPNCRPILV